MIEVHGQEAAAGSPGRPGALEDHLPSDHGHRHPDVLDLRRVDLEQVLVEDGEIGQLALGDGPFDVVGERTQMDFAVIATNVHEAEFEIKIRNHKETDIVVDIIEPMTSDWEILKKSHDFVKKDAQTAVFSVPVPKDGEAVVTYRVRVKY